ncbi:MAG: hypothetical protein H6722_04985 [Sandaracinus sp.]|nr:hypothetical protein [Sandaracinus sp.]
MPSRFPSSCRFVPLLALLVLGCFRSNGRSDGDSCDCCGTRVEIGPEERCWGGVCDPYCGRVMFDAGTDSGFVAPDASTDAGPLACPSERIDVACYGFLGEGLDNRLELVVGGDGGCYCGDTIECRATVVAPGQLALETGVCPGACAACLPFGTPTSCALPPLTEGTWEVSVNGAPAFTAQVAPPGVFPEAGATCHRVADADGCAELPSRAFDASRLCVSSSGFEGERVAIRVTDSCGGCGSVRGECRVDVFDDVVRVRAERLGISCDVDCPAVCVEREDTCWTPPLPAGTYRVMLEGASDNWLGITVGEGGTADDQCLESGVHG